MTGLSFEILWRSKVAPIFMSKCQSSHACRRETTCVSRRDRVACQVEKVNKTLYLISKDNLGKEIE